MDLFSPVDLGSLHLANRLVMAPLTRVRAGEDGVPTELIAEYYEQRASLGLIVTEGTFTSEEAKGFSGQPGIVTDEQQAGWAGKPLASSLVKVPSVTISPRLARCT